MRFNILAIGIAALFTVAVSGGPVWADPSGKATAQKSGQPAGQQPVKVEKSEKAGLELPGNSLPVHDLQESGAPEF